jgi:hypothetical protein
LVLAGGTVTMIGVEGQCCFDSDAGLVMVMPVGY